MNDVNVIFQQAVEKGIITKKTGGWYFFGETPLSRTPEQYLTANPQVLEIIQARLDALPEVLNMEGTFAIPLTKKETKSEETFTKEDVMKMLSDQKSEMDETLKRAIAAMVSKRDGSEERALGAKEIADAIRSASGESTNRASILYKEADIVPDDYLETPRVFFTYMWYYAIWDKVKNGKPVSTPYGTAIRFEFFATNVKKTGTRYDEAIPIARAVVKSRKDAEWLESHPDYNRIFFEKASDVINVDQNMMIFAERATSMVNGWGQGDVIKQAKARGITVTDDIDWMKKKLVDKIAEDIKNRSTETQLRDSQKLISGAYV